MEVTACEGFVTISGEYDAAQIYADGALVADNFYTGVDWRVPASLLFGRDCYLVTSEKGDDFYHEAPENIRRTHHAHHRSWRNMALRHR